MSRPTLGRHLLDVSTRTFADQKRLAERALAQLEPQDFYWTPDGESNSVAVLIKHLTGNMRSRWTDFLTSDGEKPTRERDREFVRERLEVEELLELWEEGWGRLFSALAGLTEDDLLRTVTIRGQEHTVVEAVTRQVSHYAQHVGQMVYITKHLKGERWETLSIPKGASETYNPEER